MIWEPHAAFCYVDDYLLLVPESRVAEVSALAQIFFTTLGIPLSWHKVNAGGEVDFLGFAVNAATGEIGIPSSKLSKALEFLDLKKGNRVSVRSIEQGRGRLLWFTWVCPALRPWLAPYFSCCKFPGAGQRIRVTGQLEKVSAFWRSALLHRDGAMHHCILRTSAGGNGAADACAAGDRAAIGGWWASSANARLREVRWFRMEIRMQDLPQWLQTQVGANQRIAFFELLAQAALVFLRCRDSPCSTSSLEFSHKCDNAASVGAVKKYLTTKAPLCFALQALTFHASSFDCVVSVSHIPGVRNTLADHISRWKHYPQTIEKLDKRKEVKDFCLRDILGPVWDICS